jgi:hypothetical protein
MRDDVFDNRCYRCWLYQLVRLRCLKFFQYIINVLNTTSIGRTWHACALSPRSQLLSRRVSSRTVHQWIRLLLCSCSQRSVPLVCSSSSSLSLSYFSDVDYLLLFDSRKRLWLCGIIRRSFYRISSFCSCVGELDSQGERCGWQRGREWCVVGGWRWCVVLCHVKYMAWIVSCIYRCLLLLFETRCSV